MAKPNQSCRLLMSVVGAGRECFMCALICEAYNIACFLFNHGSFSKLPPNFCGIRLCVTK
ncbi:mCG1049130 [Mus musculus]|nr:mCG1049130 [Mus musculus]